MSSLGIAVSGLNAAQAGLYVTGHNTANVGTPGFTRQMVFQQDFRSRNVGSGTKMQVGLGTDIAGIFQIRCRFLDAAYRQNVGRAGYHDVRVQVGAQIETILGELQGQYRFQNVLFDLHSSINELMKNPGAMETRGNFVSSCIMFIQKANDVYENTLGYQLDLNNQVIKSVKEINALANRINNLNSLIARNEMMGDNANDFRDERNLAIDQLASMAKITYKAHPNGTVDVFMEGHELVVRGTVNNIGLRYTAPGAGFVEPVFTDSRDILEFDDNSGRALFHFNPLAGIQAGLDDFGSLKGLMVARGFAPGNYMSAVSLNATILAGAPIMPDRAAFPPDQVTWDDGGGNWFSDAGLTVPISADERAMLERQERQRVTGLYRDALDIYYTEQRLYNQALFDANHSMIPRFQKQFDTMVNTIVTMLNNFLSPLDNDGRLDTINAPADQHGNRTGVELFVRANGIYNDRFNTNPLNPNYGQNVFDDTDRLSWYTLGNIRVNPELVNPSGWALLPLSESGDESDPNLLLKILAVWESPFISIGNGNDEMEPLNVNNFYSTIIADEVGVATQEARSFFESQVQLISQLDFFRMAMSAVSMDEEMSNMMRYQHSYNAAARILNAIDSMIDRIVNHLGRVGM
jgi:flagellar hook-associated protein 1 FlgK